MMDLTVRKPAVAAPASGEPMATPAMMTEAEARIHVEQINIYCDRIGDLLLELHDRKGWRALGYASWGECIEVEFKQSRSRLYQLMDAARVEKNVSNMLDTNESLPARAVDQLKYLEPEQQREVVKEAKETSPDGKLSAKQVEQAVQKVLEPDEVKPPVPSWDRKIEPTNKSELAEDFYRAWESGDCYLSEANEAFTKAQDLMNLATAKSRANFRDFSGSIKETIRHLKIGIAKLEIAAKATSWEDF